MSQQIAFDKHSILYYYEDIKETQEPQECKMVNIKQATEKLKKIVAGATLMAGIAMGTGCDTPQETRRLPTEDVVDDDDKNIINDQDNNNITDDTDGKPSENNDDDKPVEHNDNDDNPIEHNDTDDPIEDHNDIDDINDTDPIENNDNDGEPTEITDNDIQSDECASKDIIISAEKITNYSQEEIQEKINYYHDMNRSQCYGSVTEKEKFDTKGNLCIEDECNIGPNDIAQGAGAVWIDNLPFLVRDLAPNGLPPPGDTVYYRKVEQLNKGNLTDLTITRNLLTFYVKDISTVSCFAQNNAIDDVSTITMSIGNGYYNGCYFGDQQVSPSDIISTKNIQPKIAYSEFKKACKNVPNSQFSVDDEKCSTTITEFAWLENVVQYLFDKSGLTWRNITIQNTKIEKDVVNNIFRMYFSVGGQYSWAVELPNAKRCLDECYGIDGCEVSINPSADISNGCKIKEPENASLIRPNVKAKKQNLPLTNQKKQARVINMPKAKRPNLATLRVAQLARRYTR